MAGYSRTTLRLIALAAFGLAARLLGQLHQECSAVHQHVVTALVWQCQLALPSRRMAQPQLQVNLGEIKTKNAGAAALITRALLSWPPACRLVLRLRQEFLPGGMRKSQEEANAAAAQAREFRSGCGMRAVGAAAVCCWVRVQQRPYRTHYKIIAQRRPLAR